MQPTPPAPWRDQFLQHVSAMSSPEFVLSTVDVKDPVFGTAPRARYCIFRGMWADITYHEKNPAERNPKAFESDCLTFTTDIRMEKAGELFRSGSSGQPVSDAEIWKASGGGGPVEAVFWVKDDGIMTQWRVRGDAYVLAPGCESGKDGEHLVAKTAVAEWMRVVDESKTSQWKWERELDAHFGNLVPGMRGSFKNPPPGVSLRDTNIDLEAKLGQGVEDLHDEEARKNFRVVVIRPFRVESTDLSDPASARRQQYVYRKDELIWKHDTTWP